MNEMDAIPTRDGDTRAVTTRRRRGARWAGLAMSVLALVGTAGPAAAERTTTPLVCSTGPSGQRFDVGVKMPASVAAGALYTVRIDGVSSGKISHFGLNYLHDMTVEYVLPAGASYVEGSAQLVPGTGTANVLAGARLTHRGGVVTMALPARVAEGTSYTPPSIQLQLRAVGAPGSSAPLSLRRFRLTANAFLVGEVGVACEPAVRPGEIGRTVITEAVQAALP